MVHFLLVMTQLLMIEPTGDFKYWMRCAVDDEMRRRVASAERRAEDLERSNDLYAGFIKAMGKQFENMPCVDLGLMKNGANTVWCDEDIGAALMDIGIEPSAENIRKVATPEFIKGFYNLMIQHGNEMIHQMVSELFD